MLPECQLFELCCHLCEQAEEVLMPLVEHGLLVELMDIAERPTGSNSTGYGYRCFAALTMVQN